MDNLLSLPLYLGSFLLVLTVIVFIHEFGHYIVAKRAGVKIEVFSIGFGTELFGWNDRSGTRWKICLLPLGGYVKMFGDANPASAPDRGKLEQMNPLERSVSFQGKSLLSKSLIVAAGPFANFVLAFVLMTGLFLYSGKLEISTTVSDIVPKSAAAEAGLQAGDTIIAIDGKEVNHFADIQRMVSLNTGTPLALTITRQNKQLLVNVTPKMTLRDDGLGGQVSMPTLGLQSGQISQHPLNLFQAMGESVTQTYVISATTLQAIGQMITGKRDLSEISGPIGIAKYSGEASKRGVVALLWLMVVISVNLGLVNLFPIPVLDGGHLLYYIIEAIQGRPLAEVYQQWGMRIGMFLVALLIIFAIVNDVIKFF